MVLRIGARTVMPVQSECHYGKDFNGDMPVGYSEQSTLRRGQSGITAESRNSGTRRGSRC
jgi:hypothetical protein